MSFTFYRVCWHASLTALSSLWSLSSRFFAILLCQTFVHCTIFSTAAPLLGLTRVSVLMWPLILSYRLLIFVLGTPLPLQLTNQTMAFLLICSIVLLTRSPFDLHVLVPIASILPAPISNAIFLFLLLPFYRITSLPLFYSSGRN